MCETPGNLSAYPNSTLAHRKTFSVIVRPQVTTSGNITIKQRLKTTETVSDSILSKEVSSKLGSEYSESISISPPVKEISETSGGISSCQIASVNSVTIRPQANTTRSITIKPRVQTSGILDSSISSIEVSSKLLSDSLDRNGSSPSVKNVGEISGGISQIAPVTFPSSSSFNKTPGVIIRPQAESTGNVLMKRRAEKIRVSDSSSPTETLSEQFSEHVEESSLSPPPKKVCEAFGGTSQNPSINPTSSSFRETSKVTSKIKATTSGAVLIMPQVEKPEILVSNGLTEVLEEQSEHSEEKNCETFGKKSQRTPINSISPTSKKTANVTMKSQTRKTRTLPTGTTAGPSTPRGGLFTDTGSGIFTFFFVFFLFCACYMYSLLCRKKASTEKKTGSPILSEEDLRKKLLDESLRKREEKRKKAESEITPRKAKLREKLSKKNRKLKTLREANYRKTKKMAKMETIIGDLKERNLMSSDDLDLLKDIGGPHKEFLERQISKVKNIACKRKYESDLRTFALTLHYKSPAAYEYVRETFHLALPHQNTIYKWYRVVDGNPGFTNEAFEALQEKYRVDNPEGADPVFGSLIIDEMSIRKSDETDGKRYYGHVDFGEGLDIDNAPLATKALVIMLVCVNGAWKIPLGYFLTKDATGQEQAGLIKTCLRLLNSTRVRVVSLTADGTKCNLSMFKHLGCNFDSLTALKTWFLNPCSKEKIYVFLDTSHMIKLVRNTLGFKGILRHFKEVIRWSHIKNLYELQEREGLRLGNKVTSKHIFYGKFKMKVCLATQILSDSVAAALKVLMDLKLSDFSDAIGTINFCKNFNNLFDIFNSKSLKQLQFKAPVTKENYGQIKEFLSSCVVYIKNLTCVQDEVEMPVTDSKRKTGFIGFLIAIASLHGLYEMLVLPGFLKSLPMYKFCQDHLEMFFGILRSKNGFNNNPTARQLKAAYKKCLIHMQLKPSMSGNCVPIENISILTFSSKCPERVINVTSPEEYVSEPNDDRELQEYLSWYNRTEEKFDHNYAAYAFNPMDLTEVSIEILKYIAGFVVFRLNEVLKCQECIEAINAKSHERGKSLLIAAKNRCNSNTEERSSTKTTKQRRGLTEAAEDVIGIVNHCEKIVRTAHARSHHEGMREQDTPEKLANDVLKFLYETNHYDKYFRDYENHFTDQEAMYSHKFYLVKSICLRFIMLRVHHITRSTIDKSKSKRQVLNKLILFQGS